ncbi:MAG TPA: hypothetical protein VFJ93_07630 [Gaiellaceae bacterium]|nr:hypothetical protein [Gaiellaceae bacterium]
MAYAELEDLLATMSVAPGDADTQATLDTLLDDASDAITEMCGRSFYQTAQETRTYDIVGARSRVGDAQVYRTNVLSDAIGYPIDIVSISSLELAWQTGGTFVDVPQGSTGWTFLPDYPKPGWPYEDVILSDIAGDFRFFPFGRSNLQITAIFGWPSIPALIKRATIDLAREWYRQGPGGGGPIGISALGAPVFAAGVPPTVRQAWRTFRLQTFSYV